MRSNTSVGTNRVAGRRTWLKPWHGYVVLSVTTSELFIYRPFPLRKRFQARRSASCRWRRRTSLKRPQTWMLSSQATKVARHFTQLTSAVLTSLNLIAGFVEMYVVSLAKAVLLARKNRLVAISTRHKVALHRRCKPLNCHTLTIRPLSGECNRFCRPKLLNFLGLAWH